MSHPKKHYRKDIDGLRAIAVLAVVIFHLDKSWLSGGFVGVDIFFVISGYLITGIIYKDLKKEQFTFKQFYFRRIKRILPVLFVVVIATLAIGNFILIPEDFKRLANSALAAQLSYANIYFTYFLDTSYFADDASLEPLLHTWSLGVEEQFYIFYPILLWAGIYKLGRKAILLIIGLGFCISVQISQSLISDSPMVSYYMLHSRAFQLLAGGFCFFLPELKQTRTVNYASSALGLVCLVIILMTTVMLDETQAYPGYRALPVTLATMLLILCGKCNGCITHKLLGLKPLVLIGLISYSLYLWHWPVLAFAKYGLGELDLYQKLACFGLMTGLSYLSYRFVEKPCRNYEGSFKGAFTRYFMLPTFAIAAACIAIYATSGFGSYYFNKTYTQQLTFLTDNMQAAASDNFVCQKGILEKTDTTSSDCIIGQSTEPKVILWGDSHAGHYVGMLGEIASEYQFGFRNIEHSACPPLLEQAEKFASAKWSKKCAQSSKIAQSILKNYEVIIISAAWPTYQRLNSEFNKAFESTVEQLVKQGHRVILIGDIPIAQKVDRKCLAKNIKLKLLDCKNRAATKVSRIKRANRPIQTIATRNDVEYFDLTPTLCPDDMCSNYYKDSPVYFDSGHLSRDGSKIIGEAIKSDPDIKQIFSTFPSIDSVELSALPWK